jgi:HPt (histidine-containing phosphotransfer) domain-containing protein
MKPLDQAALAAALDRMWTRFRPEMIERVVSLEAAAAAFAAGSLTPPQQRSAAAVAHKLAGVLGTFGLAQGTALARELESLYSSPDAPPASCRERISSITHDLRAIVESRA